MDTTIKALTIAVTILAMSITVSLAQDYEKGMEAYQKGDYATALSEWRTLAEQGNAEAQHNLGWMYDIGQGVTADDKEAVIWYHKAAEQGISDAQMQLGLSYHSGLGIIQDNVYALMWLTIAASNGNEGSKEFRDFIAEKMTPEDISKARELARECVQKNYKEC